MNFRKLVAVSLLAAFAIGGAACTPEQSASVADSEARIAKLIQSIKAGAAVAVTTIKSAVDEVCSQGALVNAGATAAKVVFSTQTGPNTAQNIRNTDLALAALNSTCNQAASNPGDPAMASLLKTAFAAYQAAQAAKAATMASAAKGT